MICKKRTSPRFSAESDSEPISRKRTKLWTLYITNHELGSNSKRSDSGRFAAIDDEATVVENVPVRVSFSKRYTVQFLFYLFPTHV